MRLFGKAALAALALCVLLPAPRPADGQPTPPAEKSRSSLPAASSADHGRRVLLLYTESRLTPAIVALDEAFRSTLEARSPAPVTFYTEYLDVNLFDGVVPQPALRELLRQKYVSRPIDVIVAGGSRALRIALHNRTDVFSGAPVVFVAVDQAAAADLSLGSDVTGTWLRLGWSETLDLARRLEPDVRRALVVGGSSPVDRVWVDQARRQLAAAPGSIEIVYLSNLSIDDVLKQTAAAPKHTVVIVGAFLRDATGRDFFTPDVIKRIVAGTHVPVYGLNDNHLGTGAVGGHVLSFEGHGRVAAELALRVLAGERPAPTDAGTLVSMVDDRQMQRWGLHARRLPPDSVVLFRQPSLWEEHRGYVLGVAAALLLQSVLIGGLLVQWAQRRRAQQRLAERLRFETLVSDLSSRFAASAALDAEPSIQSGLRLVGEGLDVDWATVRILDDQGDRARLAQAWTRDGVAPRPAVIRESQTPWIFDRVRAGHVVRVAQPGDLPDEAAIDQQNLQALGLRATVVLPLVVDRVVAGCFSVGTVRETRPWPDELVSRLQLLAEIFSHALERRRAALAARESETRIRDLAGRLMTAQEEERRRIARDLHDHVNQELAALSISLSTLAQRLPAGTTSDLGDQLGKLHARTVTVSDTVRHLSHGLHPGILQHVGLVAAIRGYCREFEREHSLPIAFQADGDLGTVPPDVSLCLYRVVQEGLGNVAKHAGARKIQVTVEGSGPDIVLAVTDDGCGFDPLDARSRRGLGLLSLDERVRLVGGRLTVDAKPLGGTKLRIVVPLAEGQDATRDRSAG
jgi:signal transduction histidine kinase